MQIRMILIVALVVIGFGQAQSNSFGIGLGTTVVVGPSGSTPLLINVGVQSGFSITPGLDFRLGTDYTSVLGLALIGVSAELIANSNFGLYGGGGLRMLSLSGAVGFGLAATIGYSFPISPQMSVFAEIQPALSLTGEGVLIYSKTGIRFSY